jgi:type I restriction enzyme, R subunit
VLINITNEANTRTGLIDTQPDRADWPKQRKMLLEEVLLQIATPDQPYGKDQFADYVLLGSDGKSLAVVYAKRTSRDELAGKRQAADYAEAIKSKTGSDLFVFLTNGKEIQFWDEERHAPRKKFEGFYSREGLERLMGQL